jgi:phage recombination protein Bet
MEPNNTPAAGTEPAKIVALAPAAAAHPPALWQMPEDTKALMRRMYFADANEDEFALAVIFCQRTRLDPLSGQVNFIRRFSRGGPSTVKPQVSIDGFRLIAERTGAYAGQVGPWWCGDDGVWMEVWVDDRKPPKAARVGVLRHGFSEPLYAVAHWRSYVQKDREGRPTKFWMSMPEVMLAKVAEALALRKAFPHELGGVYSADEMMQADNDEPMAPARPAAPPPSPAPAPAPAGGPTPVRPPSNQAPAPKPQTPTPRASDGGRTGPVSGTQNAALLAQIRQTVEAAKLEWAAVQAWACQTYGVASFADLTNVHLSKLFSQLKRGERPSGPPTIDVRAEVVTDEPPIDLDELWPTEEV